MTIKMKNRRRMNKREKVQVRRIEMLNFEVMEVLKNKGMPNLSVEELKCLRIEVLFNC